MIEIGKAIGKALLVFALLGCAAVAGAQQVELQGVLGDRALLSVDGQRHMLRAGESTPDGVLLQRLEAGWAEVSIDGGETQRIALGSRVTRGYTRRASTEARVYSDSRGMYVAVGSINGFPMKMLLDTGATYVGLGAGTARRLGVNYRLRGKPTVVQTANGAARAFEVMLDSVAVGEINLVNVKAFVIDGAGLDVPLLGMSFLRRLEVQTNQGIMTLRRNR